MEEGDTIEVFTQQSGGNRKEKINSIKAKFDNASWPLNIKCEGNNNASVIIYNENYSTNVPTSKLRCSKFVKSL